MRNAHAVVGCVSEASDATRSNRARKRFAEIVPPTRFRINLADKCNQMVRFNGANLNVPLNSVFLTLLRLQFLQSLIEIPETVKVYNALIRTCNNTAIVGVETHNLADQGARLFPR